MLSGNRNVAVSGSLEKYKTYLVVVTHEKTIVQPYLEINKIEKRLVLLIILVIVSTHQIKISKYMFV